MIDPNDPGTLDLVAACEEPLSGAERARRHRLKKKREKESGQRAALDLKAPELALLGVALGEFRERWQRVPSKLQAVEALLPRIPVPDLAQVFPGDSAWLPDAAQQLGVYPNYVAHSVANVEQCKSHSPLMFRQTPHGQPEVDALLAVGDVVSTSYGTGPYRVKRVTRHEWRGLRQFSLVLNDTDGRKGDSYINELVAVDGRLLKLFANNQDEVFVDKQPEHPEPPNEWQVRAEKAEAELAYLRAELQQIGGDVAALHRDIKLTPAASAVTKFERAPAVVCEHYGLTEACNGREVKAVKGGLLGVEVQMCAGCRKLNKGSKPGVWSWRYV
ncbi:hypothetical protein HBN83_22795 [Pseudomonas fragi]|uniref:hypothetical protein n=1 Tax=Pseudomonas fragi TaxID=296 RepID=UPI001475DCDB|nr:hypothetical protein [Pseudomonas fragi]NNB08730.1 hypothetical protein [Pseudomonas fragi]